MRPAQLADSAAKGAVAILSASTLHSSEGRRTCRPRKDAVLVRQREVHAAPPGPGSHTTQGVPHRARLPGSRSGCLSTAPVIPLRFIKRLVRAAGPAGGSPLPIRQSSSSHSPEGLAAPSPSPQSAFCCKTQHVPLARSDSCLSSVPL